MRKGKILSLIMLGAGILIGGCSISQKVLPAHDEVLRYPLPYDLTYLRAAEAVEKIPGWEIESTEKEKGVIVARNINYSSLADSDKSSITFWVKRVNAKETTVEIAPDSQHALGGDELLKNINRYVIREIKT